MMMLNSSDLKNSNNSLYELTGSLSDSNEPRRWFVVRDVGASLGETGRLDPARGNADVFAKLKFIEGVEEGWVRFNYHGRHQELVRRTIKPEDVRWVSTILSGISSKQWQDAFRAGVTGRRSRLSSSTAFSRRSRKVRRLQGSS